MSGKPYPKEEYVVSRAATLLQCGRTRDKVVEVPREQPCNVIVVHGVNDVGTGYCEVEEGLCAGLQDRLLRKFKAATYRMPVAADKEKVLDDPDAVFFKRDATGDTDSPVIPFYWGHREVTAMSKTVAGQKTDRNGTRLDKDLSKGGGPFGNATSSLPDMWNRGVYAPMDPVDDPLRPVKTGPGRMYMVLAARRLAALVTMIRKYEPKDTVNIVAHSQGCLLTLLAQAFLMEMGQRTADTLILTHPPYGLEEELGVVMRGLVYFRGDRDQAMEGFYDLIDGHQSIHARLQTLINIVTGVAKSRTNEPVFGQLNEGDCAGMVHGRWKPDDDRDNRGKVYLYFCPEDMTVALDNMRGIGWQGVPDSVADTRKRNALTASALTSDASYEPDSLSLPRRSALGDLGPTFRQRVFTAKHRAKPGSATLVPVLVGLPPHDFTLRLQGEDDHAHVAADGTSFRESLPVTRSNGTLSSLSQTQRRGIRKISGEALKTPFKADLRGGQVDADKIPSSSRLARLEAEERGPCEEVDPIDAATAVTSDDGIKTWSEDLPVSYLGSHVGLRSGVLSEDQRQWLETLYNNAKRPDATNRDDRYHILKARRRNDLSITVQVQEGKNVARQRWQNEYSPKSFHSVIFGSRKNHRHVTAYDLSIGSGKAVSNPAFKAYLCAVADWRLKIPTTSEPIRPGILTYRKFITNFATYFSCEEEWCAQLIRGNSDYYSNGTLPMLPVLTGKLWNIVISETVSGMRVTPLSQKGTS